MWEIKHISFACTKSLRVFLMFVWRERIGIKRQANVGNIQDCRPFSCSWPHTTVELTEKQSLSGGNILRLCTQFTKYSLVRIVPALVSLLIKYLFHDCRQLISFFNFISTTHTSDWNHRPKTYMLECLKLIQPVRMDHGRNVVASLVLGMWILAFREVDSSMKSVIRVKRWIAIHLKIEREFRRKN